MIGLSDGLFQVVLILITLFPFSSTHSNRYRRDERDLDEDEDIWFNDQEDDVDQNLNDSINYNDFNQFNKKLDNKKTNNLSE